MEDVHSWVDELALEQRAQKMAATKTSLGDADMKQLTNQLSEIILRMGRIEQAISELQCNVTTLPQIVTSDVTLQELRETGASFFILVKADGKTSIAPVLYRGGFYDPTDGSAVQYHMVRTDKQTEQGPKIFKPLSEIFRSRNEAELALGARTSSNPKTSASSKSSTTRRRLSVVKP